MEQLIKAAQAQKSEMEKKRTDLGAQVRMYKNQYETLERDYNQLVRELERLDEEISALIQQTKN